MGIKQGLRFDSELTQDSMDRTIKFASLVKKRDWDGLAMLIGIPLGSLFIGSILAHCNSRTIPMPRIVLPEPIR